MIGREKELAAAKAALADHDGTVVIAISGEPGIGKTRFLAELCAVAEADALVLAGSAAEAEQGLPFGALVDALDDYLASQPPRRYSSLEEGQRAELAHVFPSLAGIAEGLPRGPQDERYRLHGATRALLELLALQQQVVLALDDLHWADEASVELLAHLVRRPPRANVALILSARRGQLPARIESAIGGPAQGGSVTAIALEALTADQSAELLGERIGSPRRTELFELSGGNPFYLEELARHGAGPAPDLGVADLGAGVPDAVAAALSRELSELPPQSRIVAEGGAVAGETFEPELAARASEMSDTEALDAIDDLLARGILGRTGAPRRFRFRHPIVHRAIYRASKPAWLLSAHARVATELDARGASALARAHHVERSAGLGDATAIEALREAATEASLRAPAAAAHWYEVALGLLADPEPGRRLGLLVPMAQCLGYAGELDRARQTLDDVLSLLPADELQLRGRIVASLARIDQLQGRHQAARELLSKALDELPEADSQEATELKAQLAGACFFNGDFEGLRHWGEQVMREAGGRDDRATYANAVGLLGCAEYMVGDTEAARAQLEQAEGMFDGLSSEELAPQLSSLTWCGLCESFLERFNRAEALFDRALSIAESTGHGHVTTLARIGKGLDCLWRGELADGRELLDTAIETALLTQNSQFHAWALWARCWAATLSGDTEEAIRLGELGLRIGGGAADPVSALVGCHLAEARFEAGEEPPACRELLLDSLGGPEMAQVEVPFQARWCELLARMELASGRNDEASVWADKASAAAEGLGIDGRTAEGLRARAAVAAAAGEHRPAAELALEAAALQEAAGLKLDGARSRALAGQALRQVDREGGLDQLRRAKEAFELAGAARMRDHVARELRALGQRTTRSKRGRESIGEGVASLSEREREIAALVAAGHTNKQIAAELYLSVKTIESHLSRIFDKLDVSKRTQVAAAMAREPAHAG